MQFKMSVDQEYVTRRMMVKGEETEAPLRCGDEVKEFCECLHFLRPALRPEHIMSKMINVAHLPVIRV
jgi:hypothetical protein